MLGSLIRLYRRLMARGQSYRPEQHYMRGAGPANRRKTGVRDARDTGRSAANRGDADCAAPSIQPALDRSSRADQP